MSNHDHRDYYPASVWTGSCQSGDQERFDPAQCRQWQRSTNLVFHDRFLKNHKNGCFFAAERHAVSEFNDLLKIDSSGQEAGTPQFV